MTSFSWFPNVSTNQKGNNSIWTVRVIYRLRALSELLPFLLDKKRNKKNKIKILLLIRVPTVILLRPLNETVNIAISAPQEKFVLYSYQPVLAGRGLEMSQVGQVLSPQSPGVHSHFFHLKRLRSSLLAGQRLRQRHVRHVIIH